MFFVNIKANYKIYLLQRNIVMAAYESDPYFQGKLVEFQSNSLNFTPYASASNPDVFCFSGNAYSLRMKADTLNGNEEFNKYKSLRINITGTVVKSNNLCCFWWTIILGSIFLFPFFFICCDWWKKIVNKIFNVENCGYDALMDLVKYSSAEEMYLMVQDNLFNHSKAEAITEVLTQSRIKNFVFNNVVVGFDCDGSNFSNFKSYMKPIKSMILRSDINWGRQVVL